uniref:tRNA-uridine aminocarboxypropyltransferase n=1 Tax=Thaumasiovibrio occultus TaxID=1891184 RepID=UPI000B362B7F|nr:DTW domain-containing protein [Thaumasiovibrio occultus]
MNECPHCGFHRHCLCSVTPTLAAPFHLALLQHQTESDKATNTGQLLERSLPHCSTHLWSRVAPPEVLLRQLADPNVAPWLVFPADEHHPATPFTQTTGRIPLFIVVDATWQQARKMVRRSPWLDAIPRVSLQPQGESSYQLRRNQQAGNLCTCEVGAQLLQLCGKAKEAAQLETYLEQFQQVYLAEKQQQTIAAFSRK